MESLQFTPQSYQLQFHFMNKLSPKFKATISSIHFRTFCDSSSSPSTTLTQTQNPSDPQIIVPNRKRRVKASSDTQFKENWLASLSYPFPEKTHLLSGEHEPTHQNDGSKWVLGIDPDVSGAVALLKTHGSVCSAQVPCFFLSLLAKVLSFSVLCYITWFGCGFIVLDIVGNCGQSGCNCGRGDPKSLILQLKLRLKTVFLKRWH